MSNQITQDLVPDSLSRRLRLGQNGDNVTQRPPVMCPSDRSALVVIFWRILAVINSDFGNGKIAVRWIAGIGYEFTGGSQAFFKEAPAMRAVANQICNDAE